MSDTGLDRTDHQIVKIFHCVHDVDGDDPIGRLFGGADIFLQFLGGDAGTADDADPAAFGNGDGQGGGGHANGHAALDERNSGGEFTDGKGG